MRSPQTTRRLRASSCVLALAVIACSARAQDQTAQPSKPQEVITKGFQFLEGLVTSILSPTATEFRKNIREGRMDAAVALYEREGKALRANKDLEGDVQTLLAAQRIKASKPLDDAVAALAEARESDEHLRDFRSFKSVVSDTERARTTYASTTVIADFNSSDPVLQRTDGELERAKQAVTANIKDIYRAHPHDSTSFVSLMAESVDEAELFRDALPSIRERLKTLDEPAIQRMLKHTSAGWTADIAVRGELADTLVERFRTGPDTLSTLRTIGKLESFGLRSSDARSRPKLAVVAPVARPNHGTYTFVDGHDTDFKSLEDVQAAIAQGKDPIIVVHVDEAPTSRRIVEKKEIESKYVSGQRRLPNPQYEIARLNCQRAQADVATQRMKNAVNPAPGWGALIQGIAEGVAAASAERTCQQFAQTAPYTEEDEISSYTYVQSDIEVVKVVTGRVISWDPGRAALEVYPFTETNSYTYPVAYGRKSGDRGNGTRTITDEELESEAAAPLKLGAMTLVAGAAMDGKRTFDATQHAAVFKEQAPAAPARQAAPGAKTPGEGAGRSVSPYVTVAATTESARAEASQPDARSQSVVVVLNPKGSIGAGFYVDATDILTNYHVSEGASTVELRNAQGELFAGRVTRKDIQLDLALLRVERAGPPVQLANTILKPGTTVEAIGHPKGLFFSLTRGVVSAVREMKGALAPGGDKALLIQTDTAINPGNSGGPLFISDKVVGINTMKHRTAEGIGFALHYSEILKFLSR